MVSSLLGKRVWLVYLCQDECAKNEGTTSCYLLGSQERITGNFRECRSSCIAVERASMCSLLFYHLKKLGGILVIKFSSILCYSLTHAKHLN